MPKLPAISGREAIRALTKAGFTEIRQSGSHIVLQKRLPIGTKTLVVPNHSELSKGTLKSILRKAELGTEEFLKLL